ncbi:MAG: mandelate racemase/muconate lactonizing enzyme family protein [Clostridiales bacterium]|jgi:L-alanine-DL-glutamate epimerase-like enolase superfamily enzyme|nr:mandelate racemase/muconate lactonizing enzyme family protein [Clostridiales bacterium]
MKISKVETAWITVPCDPPQGLSSGDITMSTDAVCRITTDEGLYGIGEARGASLPEICRVIAGEYTPLLLGENPVESQYIWDKLYRHKLAGLTPPEQSGKRPDWPAMRPYQAALAAVDLAIWDIKAKARNLSVCELLGGKPHPVVAYLSKAFYVEGQSLDEMCREAIEELERDGYTHMKMRVGRYGHEDAVRRIAAVRKAVGPAMKIGVDVNQAFDCETAIKTCKAAEEYDLMWIEEPLGRAPKGADTKKADYDWDACLGEIAANTSVPLSSGENHYNLRDCNSLVTKGGIRYMQYDATKNGGATEWLKVAALCEANGILMAPHHVPHFHIMLSAAISNAFIVECYDNKRQHPAWPHLFDGFPEVKNGLMECPTGKGWGMDINEKFLKKHGTPVAWDFR